MPYWLGGIIVTAVSAESCPFTRKQERRLKRDGRHPRHASSARGRSALTSGAMELYFSQHYDVDPDVLEEHGAFDISLVSDLPLFVDPFLLFNSEEPEYQELHEKILRYLFFLRDQAATGLSDAQIRDWYCFKEVKQNWFGFTAFGNEGHGLGRKFAFRRLWDATGVGAGAPFPPRLHDYADLVVKPTAARSRCSGGLRLGGCRHIQRSSRKARSASGGRWRPGLAASGFVRSIACCLWVMSACR
jgi:hypothetical protein